MGKETVKPAHPLKVTALCAVVGTLSICLLGSIGIAVTSDYDPELKAPRPLASAEPLPTWRTDVIPDVTAPDPAIPATTPAPGPTPKVTKRPTKKPTPKVTKTTKKPPAPYYKNCTAVRAAGAAPLYRGDPGYRSGLDRDHDGQACED